MSDSVDGHVADPGNGPVDEPSPRRTFAPVVLLGLDAGALLAVAGGKAWVDYSVRPVAIRLVDSEIGQVPLASALSYVLLASWGVLLVTRRWVRRGFAVLTVLASLGLVGCVAVGLTALPGQVRDRFPSAGYTVTTSYSPWLWTAALAALVSLAATVLAVRLVPTWPEMGRRYDAPAARAVPVARPDADPDDPEAGNLALWKAIDEGEDPTDSRPG